MKRLLLAASAIMATAAVTAAVTLAVATPAFAGDLPLQRNSYYQPQPAAALFNWTGFYVGANAGYAWGSAIGGDPSGGVLGLTGGYNYQFNPNWVLGAETDIAFSNADTSRPAGKFESGYIGTLRARLGYSVGNVMFYGTAGAAYGKGELTVGGLTNDQTHWGWTIGAGVEAMLTQNVSAKFEYLYVDLSDKNYTTVGGPVNVGYTTSLLRGGVNYRF
jgi:outer membrane immunogenic protein